MVIAPAFDPEQTVASALIVPPTDIGSTVIVAVAELTDEHVPDFMIALYFVVAVKFKYDCDAVTFAMVALVEKLSEELSHPVMLPVYPDKVKVPELDPEHTVASALTVPPNDIGSTVIVAAAELTEGHVPDFIIALYFVVAVKFKYDCDAVTFAIGVMLITKLSVELSQPVMLPV